jgi:hypothetical protein
MPRSTLLVTTVAVLVALGCGGRANISNSGTSSSGSGTSDGDSSANGAAGNAQFGMSDSSASLATGVDAASDAPIQGAMCNADN